MDTRTELARVIATFSGYKGYPSNGDYEEADAILASPVVAHIRAEAIEAVIEEIKNTPQRKYPLSKILDVTAYDHAEALRSDILLAADVIADREEQGA